VAVRVATQDEDTRLREWLLKSPDHRAILFHSGLYPFAQKLFEDFPTQVTFGTCTQSSRNESFAGFLQKPASRGER